MKDLPRERAESQQIGMDGGGSKNRDLTLDPLKRGQASQPGHGMVNRFTAAQSTGRCGVGGLPLLCRSRTHCERPRRRADGGCSRDEASGQRNGAVTAIVMSDISVRYAAAAGASVLAVDRVSFSLNAGEFLSLVALLVAARRRFLTY